MSACDLIVRLSTEYPGVRVLYLQADLLVVDKPSGLLCAPDGVGADEPYLGALLGPALARAGRMPAGCDTAQLVNAHRLDRPTSGVMLYAWNRTALAGLLRQFRQRQIEKTYVALVHGCLIEEERVITARIIKDRRRPGLSTIAANSGWEAMTTVRVLERFANFTLVEARMKTGRHHQVRVHLRSIGHPLVGDTDYGGAPLLLSQLKRGYKPPAEGERPLLARCALHAARVRLTHPVSGEALEIEAALPKDMASALNQLRRQLDRSR